MLDVTRRGFLGGASAAFAAAMLTACGVASRLVLLIEAPAR